MGPRFRALVRPQSKQAKTLEGTSEVKRLIVLAPFAALTLTACGASETHDEEHTYKGYPIDCVEDGAGQSRVMSCDFVEWHIRHDPDFGPFPIPTPTDR